MTESGSAALTQRQALDRAARWPLARLLAGVALAAAVAVGVVLLLASEVGWVDSLDRAVNRAWVDAALAHDWLVTLGKAVTRWGNTPMVILITAVTAVWQVVRRRPALATWLVLTLVTGWLLNHVMKAVVDRARPPTDGLFLDALGSSFPSGHAQVGGYAWVAFGLLALLLLRNRLRLAVAWCCWLLGVGIALSRVLLGVHWLTDVVAGALVGWTWFALVTLLFGGRILRFGKPAERVGTTAMALGGTER